MRYSSETTLFGLPLVNIAFGPSPDYRENRGLAKGIVAVDMTIEKGLSVARNRSVKNASLFAG